MSVPAPSAPAARGFAVNRPARVGDRAVWRIVGFTAVMYVVLQGGLTLLVPSLGLIVTALVVAGAMLALAVAVQRAAFGRDLRRGLLALGLGRPSPRALLAALIISGLLLTFFPIYAIATGTPLRLQADWFWVLVGAVALNGLAEETLFRGFVFGHLRRAGHSFRRAGLISMVIFAAVHLYLFIGNPPAIALLATMLAVAGAFPFAFLYERAGNTIWAGVILHVAAHAFRMVEIPEPQVMVVASAWLLVQFGAVFLVFAFRTTLLRGSPTAAE